MLSNVRRDSMIPRSSRSFGRPGPQGARRVAAARFERRARSPREDLAPARASTHPIIISAVSYTIERHRFRAVAINHHAGGSKTHPWGKPPLPAHNLREWRI